MCIHRSSAKHHRPKPLILKMIKSSRLDSQLSSRISFYSLTSFNHRVHAFQQKLSICACMCTLTKVPIKTPYTLRMQSMQRPKIILNNASLIRPSVSCLPSLVSFCSYASSAASMCLKCLTVRLYEYWVLTAGIAPLSPKYILDWIWLGNLCFQFWFLPKLC